MIVQTFTTVGKSKQVNQDCVFGKKWLFPEKEIGVIAIADGMGGYELGDYYSKATISILRDYFKGLSPTQDISKMKTDDIFKKSDQICKIFNKNNCKQGGTTLTLAITDGKIMKIQNIGDTRCYLMRDDKLILLSEDHALRMANGSKSSTLTRCLGMGLYNEPTTQSLLMRKNDVVLICSDGFYSTLSDEEIINFMENVKDNIDYFLTLLVSLYKRNEDDNISVALIHL